MKPSVGDLLVKLIFQMGSSVSLFHSRIVAFLNIAAIKSPVAENEAYFNSNQSLKFHLFQVFDQLINVPDELQTPWHQITTVF